MNNPQITNARLSKIYFLIKSNKLSFIDKSMIYSKLMNVLGLSMLVGISEAIRLLLTKIRAARATRAVHSTLRVRRLNFPYSRHVNSLHEPSVEEQEDLELASTAESEVKFRHQNDKSSTTRPVRDKKTKDKSFNE